MKSNPVKAALREGRPQVGTWLSFDSLQSARLMAHLGFPWLTLDLEHSPIDISAAAAAFAVISKAGCVPLVRVPENTHGDIKRVLDGGAMGIVVPMVDTAEQGRAAIAAAKYPPAGNRSVGGSLHALTFDAEAGDYYRRANDEILVVLQTESPRGVENAEAIYSLPGVDAIFIGPNDLRAQMRTRDGRDPTPEAHEEMIQEALRIAKLVRTPIGLHVQTVEDARMRIEQGFQFIAIGSELRFMVSRAQEVVKDLGIAEMERPADLARY